MGPVNDLVMNFTSAFVRQIQEARIVDIRKVQIWIVDLIAIIARHGHPGLIPLFAQIDGFGVAHLKIEGPTPAPAIGVKRLFLRGISFGRDILEIDPSR
jgi:hypothetical protein